MFSKSYIKIGISLALLSGAAQPLSLIHAANEINAASIEAVEDVSVHLQNVYELKTDDYNTVSFTIEIENQKDKDIQFIDYWVKVISKSGVEYTVNLLPTDKEKNVIPAQASETFSFYANVGRDVDLHDLEFHFIKWNFNSTRFEQPLGTMQVPEDYRMVSPENETSSIVIGKTILNAKVKKYSLNKSDKFLLPRVTLEIQNQGNASIKLPDMQYFVMTEAGKLYPMQANDLTKDKVLDPLVTTEAALTANIPVEVSSQGLKLVIARNLQIDTKNITLPLGMFELPTSEKNEASLGTEFDFSTEKGSYTAKLNSIKRVPWENEDLLTADLTIGNSSDQSLPLPSFTGYFKLDDNVQVNARALVLDQVIGVPKDGTVNIQLLAKVPYTYNFNEIELFLQEQEQESNSTSGTTAGEQSTSKTHDLLQFVHNAELSQIPATSIGNSFLYTNTGRNYSLSVPNVQTYTNKMEDLFVAQFLVQNKEKRFADISRWVAYFETKDGVMFPASMSEIKSKVKPEGAALYQVSTSLPLGYETSDMRLLVGEAVKDGKLAQDKNSDGYINPVYLSLPNEQATSAEHLTDLDMFPYTVSITRIGTSLQDFLSNKVALEFNYELKKSSMIVSNTEDHKLVLEIQDTKSDVKTEKVYNIDKDLKIGKDHLKESLVMNNLNDSLQDLHQYKFNVYYELASGHRHLVASKALPWFIYTD